MPGLWALIDSLPPGFRPRLIRGDVSYGSEQSMAQAERRAQPYLFKLRRSAKVKARFRELTAPGGGWSDAGDGGQASECRLTLGGWTSESRKIIRLTSTHALSGQIRLALNRIGGFMNRLAATAEQLSVEQIWALILSAAFVKWLQEKVLHPVSDGAQTLLRLTT